jgi:FkbM family methyltransferase
MFNFVFILIFHGLNSSYYGQHLQDKFLNNVIFKSKLNGIFIELGANDGKFLSNTLYFENNLNWFGLCVEPHPDIYKKLIKNRPNSKCLNLAVGVKDDILTFKKIIETEATNFKELPSCWSGILENYSEAHSKRVDEWLKQYDAKYELIPVLVKNINDVLSESVDKEIDLLSIDIEGYELELLKSIDWKKFNIKVVLVENNDNLIDFKNYMTTVGYELLSRIGFDDLFIQVGLKYDKEAMDLFFKEHPDMRSFY